MREIQGAQGAEISKELQNGVAFADFAKSTSGDGIDLRQYKSANDPTMKLFGSITIQQAEQIDPAEMATNFADNAAKNTIQQIKDGWSQDDILREIQGLSTLKDFDFHEFYSQFFYDTMLVGGHEGAQSAFYALDKDHRIQNELDKDYLQATDVDNSTDIHKKIAAVISNIVDLSSVTGNPATTDLTSAVNQVKSDLKQLTYRQQIVYLTDLTLELQGRTDLAPFLSDSTPGGSQLDLGSFTLTPPQAPEQVDLPDLSSINRPYDKTPHGVDLVNENDLQQVNTALSTGLPKSLQDALDKCHGILVTGKKQGDSGIFLPGVDVIIISDNPEDTAQGTLQEVTVHEVFHLWDELNNFTDSEAFKDAATKDIANLKPGALDNLPLVLVSPPEVAGVNMGDVAAEIATYVAAQSTGNAAVDITGAGEYLASAFPTVYEMERAALLDS